MTDCLPVYIGFDPREEIAWDVARHSLLRRSTLPLYVTGVYQDALRHAGLYTRQWEWQGGQRIDMIDERPFSTEFSFTRFLVPALCQYKGWALFVDCDFLFLADVAELIPRLDTSKAVMVCKQVHEPAETVKMDGVAQSRYARKNWSSFMLFNCGHPANRELRPHEVNSKPGSWLHQFQWLDDSLIGDLPVAWNWLEGVTKEKPKAVHYSRGGPWFPDYQSVAFAREWRDAYAVACKGAREAA